MDANTRLKSELPIIDGPERALYRASCYAVGHTRARTNGVLHRPAVAHLYGIEFPFVGAADVFKRTPHIADLKLSGRYVAKDMLDTRSISLLLNTDADTPNMRLSDTERAAKRKGRKPRPGKFGSGGLWKHGQQVRPALNGAVTRPGGAAEKACHADT